MKLKVCGMKYQENMEAVATLQPDYLGFIFYDKSSRFFDGEIPQLPYSIKKTGVFVDADLETVLQAIKRHDLKAVQLHGNESPEYCARLKDRFRKCQFERSREQNDNLISENNEMLNQVQHDKKVEIIKVFSIKDSFNFNLLKPYEGIVDYFLFDTKGKLPGGNGYTFNWDILKDYPSTTPYFLSGGIGLHEIENIKEFKKSPASKYCYAIDVNSKFEIKSGLKDINELEKFKNEISHVERM